VISYNMDLEISRSGDLTAKIGNRYLHSKYDPMKEADQFLNSWMNQVENSSKKIIIIIEPGLGYLLKIIKKKFPDKIILAAFTNEKTYQYCFENSYLEKIHHYIVDSGFNITTILNNICSGLSVRDISILTWTAGELIFKEECQKIKNEILSSLRILQGNEQTKKHFSKRWFLNGIKNFLRYDFSSTFSLTKSPIILVSSGPSLEMSIRHIGQFQHNYIIAALPSSLAILQAHEIHPDILFTTDPGYYAGEHLRYIQRETICIAPITSKMIPLNNPLSGFNQNSLIENLLYEGKELPYIPEMGTVAATALKYLRTLSTEPIYIAGLDFCMDDLKIHAQPHSFNPIILKNESRFLPHTSAFYNRVDSMTYRKEGTLRFSKSMDTYASWFKGQTFGTKTFRLNPSAVSLPILSIASIPQKPTSKKAVRIVNSEQYPSHYVRENRVRMLNVKLKKDIRDYLSRNETSLLLKNIAEEIYPELLNFNDKNRKNRIDEFIQFTDKIGQLI